MKQILKRNATRVENITLAYNVKGTKDIITMGDMVSA